jgi:hypothetical protein
LPVYLLAVLPPRAAASGVDIHDRSHGNASVG